MLITLSLATSALLLLYLPRGSSAMPWQSLPLTNIDYFNPECEYRFEVGNQERNFDVPNVLGIERPTVFYPQIINQDALIFSYDTVTMSISYTGKSSIHLKYRELIDYIPSGKIGSREWPTLIIQQRCSPLRAP
jgi:hypothetical protein